MVVGLEKFKRHFAKYSDKYIIIGGTACDELLTEQGLLARATKDIDMIIVIEQLSPDYVNAIWEFLSDGGYVSLQKDSIERKYYRFSDPKETEFPRQIEIFTRTPDALDGDNASRFVRLDMDGVVTSLSAILMDNYYYAYTVEHSSTVDGVHRANLEALICLKAKAFLDLSDRKTKGEKVAEHDIKKHKNDIFRLATLLTRESHFELPASIGTDLAEFVERVKDDLPGQDMLKSLGAPGLEMKTLFQLLNRAFIPSSGE